MEWSGIAVVLVDIGNFLLVWCGVILVIGSDGGSGDFPRMISNR